MPRLTQAASVVAASLALAALVSCTYDFSDSGQGGAALSASANVVSTASNTVTSATGTKEPVASSSGGPMKAGSSSSGKDQSSAVASSQSSTSSGSTQCFDDCETANSSGYQMAIGLVTQSCGCKPGSTCEQECATTTACTQNLMPMGACVGCIISNFDHTVSKPCEVTAFQSLDCVNSQACTDFYNCAKAC